ncbi:MAG: AIR synthase-related protein [Candidatus Pacearchaeota archaeon]|nr:AIR synthase-related protein [Candidatus Pacearchaeota archaeon]
MFDGSQIKVGDSLVGLMENGFRSNGLSLARKVLTGTYGPEWHNCTVESQNIGKLVLTPSVIYCAAVCDMFGGYDQEPKAEVHGVAHITGGGIPGKLGRVLKPSGLGAVINKPIKPVDFMTYLQQIGNVSDREAYKTWNMGQGMIIASPKPENVIDIAREHKIGARVIGQVVASPGITIKSKGYQAREGIGEESLLFS